MKTLKLLGAALAAVTMAFTAHAEKTAKAVVEDYGATLRFVYDETDYGTKDDNWFSVAEAEAIDSSDGTQPWYGASLKFTSVIIDSSFKDYKPKQCALWFYYMRNVTAITGLENLDTSAATDMKLMFGRCSSIPSLDLDTFDTSNVTNTESMFQYCSKLGKVVVSGAFDMSKVEKSTGMFTGCTNLVGGAGTVFDKTHTDKSYARIDGGPSSATPGYFTESEKIARVQVEDGGKTLRFVYDYATYPEAKKGTDWFSVADAEAIDPASGFMPWAGCAGSVTKVIFDSSFADCRPKHCGGWFWYFSSLVSVEGLENLDVSKATSLARMFMGCSSLTSLDLAGFDTSCVTDMRGMFYGCTSLKRIAVRDKFVTTSVTASDGMFYDCTALVGGAGTAYDSAKTDREYARIDGKGGQPGYFTRGQMTIATGAYESLDLVGDFGIEIPDDVDYAAGDKVTVKVEGLAKGLKFEQDKTSKAWTLSGVPTEEIDFARNPMYARVTVTYKDKSKGDKGKVELLQPIPLSIKPAQVRTLAAGVLNQDYGPADIATLWPEAADAKVNPKEWSFKGWPAGLKYANGVVSGKPTKAGEFPITATWKRKLADGKTTVSETFSAVLTVWGDDGASSFRYTDQAYVATATKMLAGVTAVSGLPAGIKFDTLASHRLLV